MPRDVRWIERRHKRGCLAVKATENPDPSWRHSSAWGTICDDFAMLKHGRGKSGPWVVFRCNDPDCPAKIALRMERIVELLPVW